MSALIPDSPMPEFDWSAGCQHWRGSLPVGIETDGCIIWQCATCPERWVDDTLAATAVEEGAVTQAELDSILAMS